jgi:site-specific recombinase XerD
MARNRQAPKIVERSIIVNGKKYERFVLVYHSESGQRVRRNFPSRNKAEKALANLTKKRTVESEQRAILHRRIGEKAAMLTPDQLLDAVRAVEKLKGFATLETAAGFYMDTKNPLGGKRSVSECADEFLLARKEAGRRPITIEGYRDKIGAFSRDMTGRQIAEITGTTVEEWLRRKRFGVSSRASYMRHLAAFFQYAVRKKYAVENPVRQLDMPRSDRTQVAHLAPAEAEQMLRTAQNSFPELVPYVAIGLFAGLRPVELHGELSGHGALSWQHIYLDKRVIVVAPEQDKTRQGRNVRMSDNLAEWLATYRQTHGCIHFNRSQFLRLIDAAKINYTKDCMRHTFGTYHWTAHRNEGETAIQLGDTIKTIKRHYVNTLADEADAKRFWSITPKQSQAPAAAPTAAT